MRSRLIAAGVAFLAIFGVGVLVSTLLSAGYVSSSELQPEATEPETTKLSAAPQTQTVAQAPTQAVEEAPNVNPPAPVLVSARGRITRTDSTGEPVVIEVGENVPLGALVELEEGEATFGLADATVEIFDGTQASFFSGADGGRELRLEAGRATAATGAGAGLFRMTFSNSDAVATVEDGQLSAINDGEGHVSVAAEKGRVTFSARQETVQLEEGEFSSAGPQSTPSAPRQIPTSFFLRVRRPPAETRARVTTIAGQASAATVVTVNGEATPVDRQGRFRTSVVLTEGRNQVRVHSQDVRGRQETRVLPIVVDSRASTIESEVDW